MAGLIICLVIIVVIFLIYENTKRNNNKNIHKKEEDKNKFSYKISVYYYFVNNRNIKKIGICRDEKGIIKYFVSENDIITYGDIKKGQENNIHFLFLNEIFIKTFKVLYTDNKFDINRKYGKLLNYDGTIYIKINYKNKKDKFSYTFDTSSCNVDNKTNNLPYSLQFFKLETNSTFLDYRKKYFELAKKYHPDNGGSVEKMQILNGHYENVKRYFNKK